MSQHVLSLKAHFIVFGALMLLTVLTVAIASVDLGALNTVVALLVAGLKAFIVITWFMHVKYSSKLTKVFVCSGFVWLIILVLILTSDYAARGWL